MVNNRFVVYTDLDSLFDSRQGILQKLLGTKYKFAEVYTKYKQRTMDHFVKKELGITDELYKKAYAERNVSDFEYYFPTKLLTNMFNIILDLDQLTGKPINIQGVDFTVNSYPYRLDDELVEELKDVFGKTLRYKHTVNVVYVEDNELRASYFKQFTHVFKYDFLSSPELKGLMASFGDCPCTNVKIVIPALYYKENEGLLGTPEETIMKCSVPLAPFIALIPCNISIFNNRFL